MFGFAGFTDVNDGFLSMSLQRRGNAIFSNNLAEILLLYLVAMVMSSNSKKTAVKLSYIALMLNI